MLLARRALARRAAIPVAALRPRAFSLSVSPLAPINLNAWLAEHGPTLKPPVANKLLFGDGDLKVMVVGGPNARSDYHLQSGEEFFLQLDGELTLRVVEREKFRDVRVGAGEAFLLPSRVPHSPQRSAHSIGLVFERSHTAEEMDGMLWFGEDADRSDGSAAPGPAYDDYFHCEDLGADLPPVIARYDAWRAGGAGRRDDRAAAPPVAPDGAASFSPPAPFSPEACAPGAGELLYRGDEVVVEAHAGPRVLETAASPFDLFVWQRAGTSTVRAGGDETAFAEGDCALVPKGTPYVWTLGDGARLLSVANVYT